MSLTTFLRNKDVRDRFSKDFPVPEVKLEGKILAQPLTNHYSLIGTAFDYLLRFYLQRHNPNVIDRGHWIAESAVELLQEDKKLA